MLKIPVHRPSFDEAFPNDSNLVDLFARPRVISPTKHLPDVATLSPRRRYASPSNRHLKPIELSPLKEFDPNMTPGRKLLA